MTLNKPQLIRIPALEDNYVWVLHNPDQNLVAVIDPAEPEPVIDALNQHGLALDQIVNTHHHHDHIGGNDALRQKYGIPIFAPRLPEDEEPIQNISTITKGGDTIEIAGYNAQIIATPGHTLNHVTYFLPDCEIAFVGDNLFPLGCGRVFEGTMEQMWQTLSTIKALPDDTTICAGHEYAAANADFAQKLKWQNFATNDRIFALRDLRAKGQATLPMRLGDEKNANPFLNCDNPSLATAIGREEQPPHEIFAVLRHAKDEFN